MIKNSVQYVAGEGFKDREEELFATTEDMKTFMSEAEYEDEPEIDLIALWGDVISHIAPKPERV